MSPEVKGIDIDRTLSGLLEEAADRWPDRPFLRIDGVDTTFATFRADVAALADSLSRKGVRPGTRVSGFMHNSLACVQAWFATDWLGATWAPLNIEWRGATLANALQIADPTLLLVDGDLESEIRGAFDARLPVPAYVIPKEHGLPSLRDLMGSNHPAERVIANSTDTAALLYTSGTTGRSKACILSHRYFVSQAAIAVRDFNIGPDDVLYCPFPLYHADATALTTVPALLTGATAALSRRFSASRFWDEIRSTGATVFDFMGATLSILYKADPSENDRNHRVRLAWGVPVPDWVEDFEERFGLQVREVYGSVEASIPVTQPVDHPRKVGSCGRPIPEFDVRVADEFGDALATGEVGEILIRPQVSGTTFDGYFGNPEATAAAFAGLWFHSGDLGWVDQDGDLTFVGRKKDSIRRRGENISPLEIEEGIEQHPGVLECAAIGVPSELTEEEVLVYVVTKPGTRVEAGDIWDHCEQVLARFQVPRFIRFLETLPKTTTGKVSKQPLRRGEFAGLTWDRESRSVVNPTWPNEHRDSSGPVRASPVTKS